MKNGTIVEQGSHADLLASGGEYASLYNMQAKAFAPLSTTTDLDNADACTEPDHLSHVSSSVGVGAKEEGERERERDCCSWDGSSWGKRSSVSAGDSELTP